MSMSHKFKLGDKVEVVESDLSKVRGQAGTIVGLVVPAYFSGAAGDGVVVKWDGVTPAGFRRTLYRASNLQLASAAAQASSSSAGCEYGLAVKTIDGANR